VRDVGTFPLNFNRTILALMKSHGARKSLECRVNFIHRNTTSSPGEQVSRFCFIEVDCSQQLHTRMPNKDEWKRDSAASSSKFIDSTFAKKSSSLQATLYLPG
jgi:hypothetical protein